MVFVMTSALRGSSRGAPRAFVYDYAYPERDHVQSSTTPTARFLSSFGRINDTGSDYTDYDDDNASGSKLKACIARVMRVPIKVGRFFRPSRPSDSDHESF